MAMKIRRRGRRQPTKTLDAWAWSSAHTLERIRLLNEKCIAAAARATLDDSSCADKAVGLNRDLWLRMGKEECKRAAHCPVLLLDFHFESPMWWHWIVNRGPPPVRSYDAGPRLRIKECEPLLREILVEACVIALSHPRAARLVFGMAPGVIAAFTALQASEIDSIVLTHSVELQLRWADNRIFWKNLLLAATAGADVKMAEVRLHCLQLLGN
jgi:hypothetical protein